MGKLWGVKSNQLFSTHSMQHCDLFLNYITGNLVGATYRFRECTIPNDGGHSIVLLTTMYDDDNRK